MGKGDTYWTLYTVVQDSFLRRVKGRRGAHNERFNCN